MNIKTIAKRIPDNVRSEILLTDENIIDNAVSSKDNPQMKILLRVWFEFIEPELENEYQKLKNL